MTSLTTPIVNGDVTLVAYSIEEVTATKSRAIGLIQYFDAESKIRQRRTHRCAVPDGSTKEQATAILEQDAMTLGYIN